MGSNYSLTWLEALLIFDRDSKMPFNRSLDCTSISRVQWYVHHDGAGAAQQDVRVSHAVVFTAQGDPCTSVTCPRDSDERRARLYLKRSTPRYKNCFMACHRKH